MATMVWRVTPTFSASCACVISPAWKRSVRMLLVICGWPLPIGASADAVVVKLGGGRNDAAQHGRAEQRIGAEHRIDAEGEPNEPRQRPERGHDIAVARA